VSHHLDSPLARQDVRLDITDLYAFRGEIGTVFVINVCHSLGGATEPGYHPEGKYEFKVDLDGDAVEDLTYRFVFGERDAAGVQPVVLHRLHGRDGRDPLAGGELVAEGTSETILHGQDGLRAWTGHAGDPFWIEPDVLHAVGHAFQDGTTIDLGDWTPANAVNHFADQNAYAIVLEVPDAELADAVGGRIGVWAVASLQTDAGGWRSINRVGLPMIHPLFTQYNEQLGDDLNAGEPTDDLDLYGDTIIDEVAGVVAAYGTAADPRAYAQTVARRFLPNVLPYRVGTPAAFGFAEFNGRSLIDNAPDVMFTIAANTPVTLSIGKESVTSKPRPGFPYVPPVADPTA
jgi:hypothetical protein